MYQKGYELDPSTISWDVGYSAEGIAAVQQIMATLDVPLGEHGFNMEALLKPTRRRYELVTTHAWAVPSVEAIDMIVKHSPAGVVEIGAGTGYWARLLRERGLFVMAFDEAPHDNPQAQGTWSPVEKGGPEKAALWPQLTLFLCWPPYNLPMAHECLRAYSGSTVAYVGEGYGMATGDDAFHDELEDNWDLIDEVALPRWFGIRDDLHIYKRKGLGS